MLRQRMNADDDMRAPFFKLVLRTYPMQRLMKELARLGPELVDRPVEILHPVLLVPQHPVVNVYQLFGDVMRFFDRLDDPDRRRLALPKLLKPIGDRLRRRPMPAAGVGGDDENLGSVCGIRSGLAAFSVRSSLGADLAFSATSLLPQSPFPSPPFSSGSRAS